MNIGTFVLLVFILFAVHVTGSFVKAAYQIIKIMGDLDGSEG